MRGLKFSPLFFGALLFFSCRTIKPEAPAVALTNIPAFSPITSQLILPVRADLSSYFKLAEKLIPAQIKGEDNPCEGLRYSYLFERGPLIFLGKDNQIKLSLTGKYQVSGSYCAKCAFDRCLVKTPTFSCGVHEPMRNIAIGFNSNLSLSSKFGIQTKTALDFIKPIDPCKISFLQVDVTDKLIDQIKASLQDLAKQTDIQTASYPFRNQLQGLWSKLNTEMPAGDLGYFRLQPLDLSLNDLRFDGNLLHLQMGIRCQPQFSLRSEAPLPKPLPDMSNISGAQGFTVYLDASLPYKELGNLVKQKLGDTTFDIKGRVFQIDEVTFVPASQNKLGIRVKFSGNKKGIIYLTGTPLLDTLKNELSMPDMSFDIKTRNLLVKTASWLLDNKIETSLRKQMVFALKPILQSTQQQANLALNRTLENGIGLSGRMSSLQVQSIYTQSDKLMIRILTKGTMAVEIK